MKPTPINDTPTFVQADALRAWCTSALVKSSVPTNHAHTVANALVQTSLWGIDSHGVSRLPHYLSRIAQRSINPNPNISFMRTASATGKVDGGHGLGIAVCHEAMQHAVALARECGIGCVGVRNSSHCGAIGLYTRQAVQADMIGIAFTHSDSFVVPYGGKHAYFGTNPISIALPSNNPQEPLCVDMATSIVPWNRIMNARRDNHPVPPGWGVDARGEDTTDPHAIRAVKPMADHKGFALAFLIDMLCGPLNEMPFGPSIPKMYENLDQHRRLGSLFIALDYRRFGSFSLPAVISEAIQDVKKQEEAILFPGEPEYISAKKRTQSGIPIEPNLLAELAACSHHLQIPPLLAA